MDAGPAPGTCYICYDLVESPSVLCPCAVCLLVMCEDCRRATEDICPFCRQHYSDAEKRGARVLSQTVEALPLASGAMAPCLPHDQPQQLAAAWGHSVERGVTMEVPRRETHGEASHVVRPRKLAKREVLPVVGNPRGRAGAGAEFPVVPAEVDGAVAGAMTPVQGCRGTLEAPDDMSSSPLTPISLGEGQHVLQLQDSEWGLAFDDASDTVRCTATSDPIHDVVDNIRSSTDEHKLRRAIHSRNLTMGFRDVEETYATTMRWLKEIVLAQPSPQPMDLAVGSAQFSLRYLLPAPHRQAVFALSSRTAGQKRASCRDCWLTLAG